MSFRRIDQETDFLTKDVKAIPVQPTKAGWTASELQAAFDNATEEVMGDLVNGLMDELEDDGTSTGTAASDSIGVTYTDMASNTVRSKLTAALNYLRGQITAAVLGSSSALTSHNSNGTAHSDIRASVSGVSSTLSAHTGKNVLTEETHGIKPFTDVHGELKIKLYNAISGLYEEVKATGVGGDADTLAGNLPTYFATADQLDDHINELTYVTGEHGIRSNPDAKTLEVYDPTSGTWKSPFPTSLPANGGNADTVDGKDASYFATSTDVSTLSGTVSTLSGDLSTLDGIVTSIDELLSETASTLAGHIGPRVFGNTDPSHAHGFKVDSNNKAYAYDADTMTWKELSTSAYSLGGQLPSYYAIDSELEAVSNQVLAHDLYLNQSVKTSATPTFAGVLTNSLKSQDGTTNVLSVNAGASLTRNVADSTAAFVVNQDHISSTGNIFNAQSRGVNKFTIDRSGNFSTTGTGSLTTLYASTSVGTSSIYNLNGGQFATITFNSSGTTISSGMADANTTLIVNKASSSATGNIFEAQLTGTNKFYITKDGAFVASSTGQCTVLTATSNVATGSITNNNFGPNYGKLGVESSDGTYITRNLADAYPAFYVRQAHASSTGDILQLRKGASTQMVVFPIDGAVSGVPANGTKFKITPEGGYAISLTNKTGSASVKGTVVSTSSTTDNAFTTNPIDGDMPFGVVYEAGVADGSACWVVVSGIADVLIVNGQAATRGYIAYSSATTAGHVDLSATVPATSTHNREVGHTLETKSSGTNVLIKCVLHFN